jgi:hypothetical protein
MKYSLIIITILSTQVLFAQYSLNSYFGDVKIVSNGKNIPLKPDLIVPNDAVIITGSKSQAHLYDKDTNAAFSISSNQKINITSLQGSAQMKTSSSYLKRLSKEKRFSRSITTGSVRADDEGKKDIAWAEDDESNSAEIDRTADWKNYTAGKYNSVIKSTQNAADDDGRFLYASSVYLLEGDKVSDKAASILEKVIAETTDTNLKSESKRILSVIYFSKARYEQSYINIKQATQYTNEKNITETDYYIITQSSFYTNRSDEGRAWLSKMKKYHKEAPLLKQIQESE